MATKKTGFKIRIDAFVEIDKTNFSAQAKAFALMASIKETGKLPDGFFDSATILAIDAKQGSAEIPDLPVIENQGDVPLTTDPLPEGATILEAATDLAGHIYQTVRLADGSEIGRRISAEQDATEVAERDKPPVTEQDENGKVTKRGGKPVTE